MIKENNVDTKAFIANMTQSLINKQNVCLYTVIGLLAYNFTFFGIQLFAMPEHNWIIENHVQQEPS